KSQSMVAEKADISETIVNVDSQMIQKNDVRTKRFKPHTTMSTKVHQAAETVTTSNELDLLFGPLFNEYFNGENQVVLKSSAVTITDASNKRQQQPDSTSFTSTHGLMWSNADGENLDKMKEKGDACIFVGYSTQSKAYKVFNKRTRMIVETIHVNFDELTQMASDHVSSDPDPQCPTMVHDQDSLSPSPQSQENIPQVAETLTTSNELELLYSPMFNELLNGTSHVLSKSSAVYAADNPDKRQQHNTTHTSTTTD
ncbi:hypothetical protein Tco_0076921, partial [Tanacetum coccineum]